MTAITKAQADCIAQLASLRAPQLSPRASEDELLALSDFMFEVAQATDRLFEACGVEFIACAPGGHGFAKALAMFRGQTVEALTDARCEIQEAAEISAAEEAEAA